MNKIYKYFMQDDDKKTKKKEEMNIALLQGLNHINKRKINTILTSETSGKYNGVIEGFSQRDSVANNFGVNLNGFNASDRSTIERLLRNFRTLEEKYKTLLTDYLSEYKIIMERYKALDMGDPANGANDKGVVHKCEVTCEEANSDSQDIKACQTGCKLKAPYLLDCQDTYISTNENSCQKTVSSNRCNPDTLTAVTTEQPYLADTDRTDRNGVTLLDGCCACGGGKFGKPAPVVDNVKYKTCYQYENTKHIDLCLNASIENETEIKNLPKRYKDVVKMNNDMINTSDDLLTIVNQLKKFNIDITSSKNSLQGIFNDNSVKYDALLNEIGNFTKQKKNTLNMRVSDSIFKKSAYDFRNNVWLILAIAFGFTAFLKIKNL